MSTNDFWTYFFKLYESTPRQGPGLDTTTRKALATLPFLTSDTRLLDIGCGSGMQTLELARSCQASIMATDIHAPFLEILQRNATKEGLAERIQTQVADMAELPFEDERFDALWAEGSIFIIGFQKGLELWRRLLKPNGYLVVSELTWFKDDPPAELREFCLMDPNEDASLPARRRAIEEAGYTLLEEFPLAREGWWDAYYKPILERLDAFEARHADHQAAMDVVKHHRTEIDLFHRYEDVYGYTFFIMKK